MDPKQLGKKNRDLYQEHKPHKKEEIIHGCLSKEKNIMFPSHDIFARNANSDFDSEKFKSLNKPKRNKPNLFTTNPCVLKVKKEKIKRPAKVKVVKKTPSETTVPQTWGEYITSFFW